MTELRFSVRDLRPGRVFDLATGSRHRVVVEGYRALLVEMADLGFNLASAALLPASRDVAAGRAAADGLQAAGLATLRTCILHARAHPEDRLLITGHADCRGAVDYNAQLSRERAESVLAALTGDAGAWAAIADRRHRVVDYQQILRWIAHTFGWSCDPGRCDDDAGPTTRAALRRFQSTYNAEFSQHLTVDGVIGLDTWRAFLALYDRELASSLDVDAAGLQALRAGLHFLGPRVVGCGSNHPYGEVMQSSHSAPGADGATTPGGTSLTAAERWAADRRVDILFFKPDQLPRLDCHPGPGTCAAGTCEIYRSGCFKLECRPSEPAPAYAVFHIQRLIDGSPARGVIAVLERPDGAAIEQSADSQGVVRVRALGGETVKLVRVIDDERQEQLASVDDVDRRAEG